LSAAEATVAAPVGILGGTFNPVHCGHLRSAVEVRDQLGLGEVRLLPCAVPPHRETPACSADHRARMVELAIAGEPGLLCDRRELARAGASYSVDTLAELRRELGPRRGLCLVMGGDAAGALDTWHRWRELLEYAHLVVIARPGWELPAGAVGRYLDGHRVDTANALHARAAGNVLTTTLRQLSISSTEIRDLVAAGRSAAFLTPRPVLDYIGQHALYGTAAH